MPDSRKLGKEKEGEIQLQNSEKKYNTQDTLLRKTTKPKQQNKQTKQQRKVNVLKRLQ